MNRQEKSEERSWEASPPLSHMWELICPPALSMTPASEEGLSTAAFGVTGN